jgi:hypothetical protein
MKVNEHRTLGAGDSYYMDVITGIRLNGMTIPAFPKSITAASDGL